MTKDKCIKEARKIFDVKKRRKRDADEKFTGNITEISSKDFQSTVASGVTIILFGIAWCPHSQHDLELMTEVQEQLQYDNVEFALVNCASVVNLDLCFDELKNGIPTINTFINGKRIVKDFSAKTVGRYFKMIRAHVKGGDDLHKWKVGEKYRDSDEEND